MTLVQMKKRYLLAKDAYYNSDKAIMSDAEFDALEDKIRKLDPKWSGLKKAGAKVKKMKAKLPIPIFSLDKTKPHTVDKWLEANQSEMVVISDKIDGSSLEIVYKDGVPTAAYTRGNGIIGGDVSYILPHLRIPQKVGRQSFIIRCEAVFSTAAFSKYKAEFDAARNAASGILNRTDIHPAARDLSVVVLQVLEPNGKSSRALTWAKNAGFTVVPWKLFRASELNGEKLSKLMTARKAKSKWKLDGMVLTLDKVNRLPKSGNPDWAVAFKENISTVNLPVATVKAVEWEVSPHGYLKPTAVYDPITWDDSTLTRATAFNARFVETNGIGPGAKIKIVRSGDIIPKIEEVVKKAKAQMPDPRKFGDFVWSKNRVDLVLTKPTENDDVRIKILTRFFTEVGVDFMKEGTVRKMYEAGFTNISKIMKASAQDFLRIPNVKEATANKLHTAIHKVLDKGIPIVKLMDASGTFPRGLGSTRFQQLQDKWGLRRVLAEVENGKIARLRDAMMELQGWQDTTVSGFMLGAPRFLKWLSITGLKPVYAKEKVPEAKTQKLKGVAVTFTGYRSAEQEATVTENGGTIVSFGSKTTHLLYRPGGKESTKLDKARKAGTPVLTWDAFAKTMKL
jgi:DNA ligase (NAD+)